MFPLPRLSGLTARLLPALLAGPLLPGALLVREAVHGPEVADASGLFGLSAPVGWSAPASGGWAAVLLEDSIPVEAAAVAYGSETGAFRLLGSDNYRDWWTLAEAAAPPPEGTIVTAAFDARPLRYLRFEAVRGEPGRWMGATVGTTAEVEAATEQMQPFDWGDPSDPTVIETMMAAAFDWQWNRVDPNAENLDWLHGAFHAGISAAATATGDPRYRAAILQVGTHADWTLRRRTSGKGLSHADDHCMAQAWLEHYLREPAPDPQWIADLQMRIDRVMAAPLPGRQDYSWCDALFMAPPVYGRLAAVTGEVAYQTFIDAQWWDATEFLYDPEWNLYYRDAGYFGKTEANGEPVFWSRGNGWVVGGLVRMLQFMPVEAPRREDYIDLLRDMAARLAAIQDPGDGLWRSSLLAPERFGNEPETSGSAFFVYGLAWGINAGLLDRATFGPVVEAGWAGLASMLTRTGEVRYIQQVGAAPALNNQLRGAKEYGYGAFLLAATEMARYFTAPAPGSEAIDARRMAPSAAPRPAAPRASTGWQALDDFSTDGGWTTVIREPGTGARAARRPDPWIPDGSAVLEVWGGTGSNFIRSYRPLPAIAEGQVATLYQRFAVDDSILDMVFGVSDASAFSGFADFETGLRIYYLSNRFEVRAGGTYEAVSADLIQLETWYEVWTVIDNAADTYAVYLQGGSNYREQTLLAAGIPFRNGTSRPLVTFAVCVNPNAGLAQSRGSVYLDDLSVDLGAANLSRPPGVRVPSYSPWSDQPRNLADGSKQSRLGVLWDDAFPWVRHAELGDGWYVHPVQLESDTARWLWSPWAGWAYFHDGADPAVGGFVYVAREQAWWFVPAGVPGWVYDFGRGAWEVLP